MHSLLIMMCFFQPILANLKNCIEKFEQPNICFTNTKGYKDPINSQQIPLVLETRMILNEIVDINFEKNLISIIVVLFTQWTDKGLAFSNDSPM